MFQEVNKAAKPQKNQIIFFCDHSFILRWYLGRIATALYFKQGLLVFGSVVDNFSLSQGILILNRRPSIIRKTVNGKGWMNSKCLTQRLATIILQ